MKIPKLTFNEYFVLEDKTEQNFAIKYIKESKDIFSIGDFTELSFKTVKNMQSSIADGLKWENIFDLLENEKGLKQKAIGLLPVMELAKFKLYIDEQIQIINTIESIALSHSTTNEEEIAGIEDLSDLGTYLQFRELANNDILKIEAIGKMKYSDCFLELVARKRLYDYKKAYSDRRNRKH